jgi:transcriptional regulator with XRE-family HTH domain
MTAAPPRAKIVRSLSRYGREAVIVLGQRIRLNRINRKLTIHELADRVGVSPDLIKRIERGDPRCGIGLVFEAATVVGVTLFEEDREQLHRRRLEQDEKLSLLPRSIRKPQRVVKDDF